jgi:hypothetical protein
MRPVSLLPVARLGRSVAIAGGTLLIFAGHAVAADGSLPNPCELVSPSLVSSALGIKSAPVSRLSTVINVSTCAYKGGALTVSVGYTALTNPAPPATQAKVRGIPSGIFETYTGSTQTEVTFFKGTAATGIYGVVRNFAKIPKKKLLKVAVALYNGLGSSSGGSPGGTLIK